MLAFVLAIGMSFAFTSANEDDYYAAGYIQLDGQWYTVNVNCESSSDFDCMVQIQGEQKPYAIHTQKDVSSPTLKSENPTPTLIPDPRL